MISLLSPDMRTGGGRRDVPNNKPSPAPGHSGTPACRFAHETLQDARFLEPYVDDAHQAMTVRGNLWPAPEQLAR